MAYLNKVMLIGNLGKDPNIHATAGGRKSASFSIATTRRYRDNNGEQKEQTDWHNIVCWGRLADAIEKLNVRKGTQIYVEGVLTNHSWTDQNGQKRYSTDVTADNIQLLGSKPIGNNNTPQNYSQGNNPYHSDASPAERQMGIGNEAPMYDENGNPDDDLPF